MKKEKRIVLIYILLIFVPSLLAVIMFSVNKPNMKIKDYVRMTFPLRKIAYQLHGFLHVELLQHNIVGNIHLGREGWIFYFTRSNGNSYDDFWGISSPSTLRKRAQSIRQFIEKPYGIETEYLFLVAPNKESIYPELTSQLFLEYRNLEKKNVNQLSIMLKDWTAGVKLESNTVKKLQ